MIYRRHPVSDQPYSFATSRVNGRIVVPEFASKAWKIAVKSRENEMITHTVVASTPHLCLPQALSNVRPRHISGILGAVAASSLYSSYSPSAKMQSTEI